MSYALDPVPTTDLSDAHPEKVRQVMLPFRDFGAKRIFAGRIRTAVTMEDTKLVQQELFKTPGEGAVIVLDGGGSFRSAMLGDLNADILVEHGWAGIVINGVVRDSRRLAEVDLGIKALGTTPVRSAKRGIGALDVPVAFGNVLFETGQCIYCDEDGVLVTENPLG
ncbi:MAG: ribonuclease E activity regulator RraA [Hyphomicrobiales bacterium]|nr:ribonuclease E activity regulator RraA [Hyphomicrobiales bacterium]MCY4048943.1 ribonuclease E activity regulator RraA [Hyphomicrobiales bacterium]MCY4052914.1 ribonuclease E activity regulator RraA [Hyphomicrobiales bacterium]